MDKSLGERREERGEQETDTRRYQLESQELQSKLEVTASSQLLLLFHSMVIQLENCELVGS